jgi:hypothetical protein
VFFLPTLNEAWTATTGDEPMTFVEFFADGEYRLGAYLSLSGDLFIIENLVLAEAWQPADRPPAWLGTCTR